MKQRAWIMLAALSALGVLTCCAGGAAGRVASPTPLASPPPAYPAGALALKMKGRVELSLTVNRYGESTAVQVLSEDPPGMGFGASAADAVRGWIWEPAHRNDTYLDTGWRVSLAFDPRMAAARKEPVLLHRSPPPSPDWAKPGFRGAVVLMVGVRTDGTAGEIKVLREEPKGKGLGAIAKKTVRRWRWRTGIPGRCYILVPFRVPAEEESKG